MTRVEEKAKRYDSLQLAIDFTIERYKERQKDAVEETMKYIGTSKDAIGLYNRGLGDAYTQIIDNLINWSENYEYKKEIEE